jgi:hypothetical protein
VERTRGFCQNHLQGACSPTPAAFTDPVHAYPHGECAAITGGAYVPDNTWPASFTRTYLFGDFVSGKIFVLSSSGVSTEFAAGLGNYSVVDLEFGPAGLGLALYYLTYADGGGVRRITYSP